MSPEKIQKAIEDKLVKLAEEIGEARLDLIATIEAKPAFALIRCELATLERLTRTREILEASGKCIRSEADVSDQNEGLSKAITTMSFDADPIPMHIMAAYKDTRAFLRDLIAKYDTTTGPRTCPNNRYPL